MTALKTLPCPGLSRTNKLPHKMPRKTLFAYTICFLSLIPTTKGADPKFTYIDCPNATETSTFTYAPNSTYQTNLNNLLSVLSSNSKNASNGFYNFTAGTRPPDVAYGLFLCRGDVVGDACRDCVSYAAGDVIKQCPSSKQVTIWYDECLLRFSNQSIFATPDGSLWVPLSSDVTNNATGFSDVLGEVMTDVANRASNGSDKKFATAHANYSALQSLYGLAQCTPDLSKDGCKGCLLNANSKLPTPKLGARLLFRSCYVWYEVYPFFNASFGAAPPPPSAVLPPGSSPGKGNGGISSEVIIATVVPIAVALMIFIAGFCIITRRAKKKYNSLGENDVSVGYDISTVQSLQYDLRTIQTATNNFSDTNKIGEGGFGAVYKGLLSDGQEVAVKRLSRHSGQGAVEFKNEMVLVAKLQHRNLVRLLGFCLEGEEKILIYEFVPNKSLDYFLFDPQEQAKLNWSRRYKIIGGIARGMLYLHEDSRLRIIHRDLKASNVLLDGDMNAKISDFGMSRIFGVDQTQGNTSRVVGTFGYMSPEYVMHGQFSAKSDVFSFGVLVLEIISGKKVNNFYQSDGGADLLSYSWKLWREGKPLNLIDRTLEGSYSRNEVTRCIHIALLCVQGDPDARPSMATVVLMLNSYSASLSLPQQPRSLGQSRAGSHISELELNQSTSKSVECSVFDASITEVEPR